MLGFDVIMRLQTVITVVTGVLTVVYIVADRRRGRLVGGVRAAARLGAAVHRRAGVVMTGFGLGWVNAAADYSRYLPRTASSRGVVGWTTFGGARRAGRPAGLRAAAGRLVDRAVRRDRADPIGALATLLPTWFLVPFVVVAVLGLVGGAVLDIYSSGLALLALGLRIPRWSAALVDGVIMVLGTIYVVFFADNFIGPFQGFLITLGVPIAAWAGVMLADIALRRRDYAERRAVRPGGRYGASGGRPWCWSSSAPCSAGAWSPTRSPSCSTWQGYLLEPFGLGGKDGAWAFANLGVLVAFAVGFLGWLVLGRSRVRAQEA